MSPIRTTGARAVIAGILGAALVASPVLAAPAFGQVNETGIFINEIHYDNDGTDTGEAIEVAAAPGTDLAGWSLELYNGANGTSYGTYALPDTVGDSGAVAIDLPVNGLQNGAPDGIALIDATGAVVEFLSYEGAFAATTGPAAGITSTDIGVEETASTPVGYSLQRTGSGETGSAFSWSQPAPASFGAINNGQTFAGITGDGEPGDGEPGDGEPDETDVVAFFNEFHYDNTGADTGEAIEVAAAPGSDLSGWSIVLYNGSNGSTYDTLPLSGVVGETAAVAVDAPGLQNGSPDGLALVDAAGTVVEFLSYEGPLTATNGPASGMTSIDVGVEETGSTAIGLSLQRTGSGDTAANFTWTGPADESFGTLNAGQTFAGLAGPDDGDGDPGPIETVTIAEIQGDGDASPLDGDTVTTSGIVTASYPAGGYNGYFIQTQGTGTIDDAHTASDAVFVYSPSTVGSVGIGDLVEVTGEVTEFFGLTEVLVESAESLTVLDTDPAEGVTPAAVSVPGTAAEREALEGMLLQPQGDYTVTNTYITNQYAEVGLAVGTSPLVTPTEIARPGTPEYDAAVADNAARAVTLDDGASINFFTGDSQDIPLPYLSTDTVTVGAPVTFTSPVVFDFRNSTWKLQPTTQLTVENAPVVQPVEFGSVREAAPRDVGGDVSIASFNVLNYFSTTGDELTGCQYYLDREGNPISVRTGCLARGAADDENLARQEVKIVTAINALGADVVSLQEIENSAAFGKDRDEALSTLVAALNADLGEDVWAFVPSPAAVPADEDVIRNAFIYRAAAVEPIGESSILLGSPAFGNAREPVSQAFRPVGAPSSATFIALANHFKSKGSGSGADADQGDGQGGSNASRVAQAEALVAFADEKAAAAGTEMVFLVGDFNSYTQEDPMQVFYDAGYTNLGATTGEYTYSFGGQDGSLDHILASTAAATTVTDVDIWNINAGEAVALEYSRYNYNATLFYDESVFRSSDHDPIIVGLDLPDAPDAMETPRPSDLTKRFKDLISVGNGTIDPGSAFTITVGETYADDAVWVWMFSPAEQLGDWQEVSAEGTITVTLPEDAKPKTSRIAVYTGEGELIGWTTIKATPPGQESPPEDEDDGPVRPFLAAIAKIVTSLWAVFSGWFSFGWR